MDNSAAEDTVGTNLKRRRKPSEKVLELQAEKVRKPSRKMKPSGKSSKTRNNSLVEQETSVCGFADDVSEE